MRRQDDARALPIIEMVLKGLRAAPWGAQKIGAMGHCWARAPRHATPRHAMRATSRAPRRAPNSGACLLE